METKTYRTLSLPGIFGKLESALDINSEGVSRHYPIEGFPLIGGELGRIGLNIKDLLREGTVFTVKYIIEFEYEDPEDYSSDVVKSFRTAGFRHYSPEHVLKHPQDIDLGNKHKLFEQLLINEGGLDPVTGISGIIYKSKHFTGKYSPLYTDNGVAWCRPNDRLNAKYLIVRTYESNNVNGFRTIGYNYHETFKQTIAPHILEYYRQEKCVMLGVRGFSENTKIEVDHKDGRKNDERVSNVETQRLDDFQPLCKAANDVKRQICKHCKATNIRWDAKNIQGNPYSFYEGTERYDEETGCVGCYQYDPVAYRKKCVEMLSKETVEYVMKRIYSTKESKHDIQYK